MRSGAGGGSWPSSSFELLAQALGDLLRLRGRRGPCRGRQPGDLVDMRADQRLQSRTFHQPHRLQPLQRLAQALGQQGHMLRRLILAVLALQHARQGQESVEPGRRHGQLLQLGDERENLVEGLAVDAQLGFLIANLGQGDGDIAAPASLGHGRAHGGVEGVIARPEGGSGYRGRARSRCAAPRPNAGLRSPLRRAQIRSCWQSAYVPRVSVIRRRRPQSIRRICGRQAWASKAQSVIQVGLRRSDSRGTAPVASLPAAGGVSARAGGTSPAAGA